MGKISKIKISNHVNILYTLYRVTTNQKRHQMFDIISQNQTLFFYYHLKP